MSIKFRENRRLNGARNIMVLQYLQIHVVPPYGRTSRVWDSLFVMKSGCAGGRGFAPRPGQYSKESFSSYQETGKVFSPELPFYSKF